MTNEEKKERNGYLWVETFSGGGYWSKISGPKHSHKLPFFCPYEECKKPTGTIDNECMLNYGICRTCFVLFVENRQNPLIDVDFYRKRLQERGF